MRRQALLSMPTAAQLGGRFQPSSSSEYGAAILTSDQAQTARYAAWVVTPLLWGSILGVAGGLCPGRSTSLMGGVKVGTALGAGWVAYMELSGRSADLISALTAR
jgi:hypothetical protein